MTFLANMEASEIPNAAKPMVDGTSTPLRPWPTELDARRSSPQKVTRAVLAAMTEIPLDHPQYVRTSSYPVELLQILENRGLKFVSRELPDGSWRTLLRRDSPHEPDGSLP